MFVKSIICGKGFMFKKLDIKGRSRMGIILVPKCSIKIVLEEKPMEDWYKLMLTGKSPPGIGHMFRSMMVQSEANFERVQKLSFLTTSKGRYYRKT